jgi:hypothetical protein
MGKNKGQPSDSSQKYHQGASKEGKKKWKGNEKKTTVIVH